MQSELERGERVPLPYESKTNRRVAMILVAYFLPRGIPFYRLSVKTEVAAISTHVGVRAPDLRVFSDALLRP